MVSLRALLVGLLILVLHREQVLAAQLSPPPLLELLLSLFHLLVHYGEGVLLVGVIGVLRVLVDVLEDPLATLELPGVFILDLVLAHVFIGLV